MAADVRLADLLAGLSMVADLGFGLPPGTAVRCCLIASAVARRMDLADEVVRDCYFTGLLMHVGCVSVAHETAVAFGDDIAFNRAVSRTNLGDPADVTVTLLPELTRGMPPASAGHAAAFLVTNGERWARRADTGVCEVARATARRLGLPQSTQHALYHAYESWAGGWAPSGLRGDDIPIASRVARVALDAAVFSHLGGPDAAAAAVNRRAGVLLDPTVVAAFTRDPQGIVADADGGDPGLRVLDVEPEPVVCCSDAQLHEVAAAFGDLADAKVPCFHGHSTEVARLAVGAARRLGLGDAEAARVQLAGLLQDVGRVSVSNAVWEKPAPLTRVQWEQVRMHAYYSERVLMSSPSLTPIAGIAGMHHERLDGSGYHRSTAGVGVPMTARILAVADAFAAMTRDRPFRSAMTREHAADTLVEQARAKRFDHDAATAVLAEAGQHLGRSRLTRPAGLSDREAEVLTLIAQGHSNTEVAARLFISRRTAEHHAQHIYTKIGVSTRAGAALFAMQHDMLRPDR